MRSRELLGAAMHRTRLWRRLAPIVAVAAWAMAAPVAATGQPFAPYMAWSGDGSTAASNGWLAVPDSAALNPQSEITLEGWFKLAAPFDEPAGGGCRSLVGKDMAHGYWLGVCGSTVTASFGGGPALGGGTVTAGVWTHVAVTWDGAVQRHYVDGEVAAQLPVSGALVASGAELRIGSDVSWPWSPAGAATEVRLWNVARTQEEIQATINVQLQAPQAGLVAVWSLNGAGDALDANGGAFQGAVTPVALVSVPLVPEALCGVTAPSAPGPPAFPTLLCLAGRFAVTVGWRDGSGASGFGTVVPAPSVNSGLFWFFTSDNWEMMVKTVDGCDLNSAFWLFTAATTNVFYRLQVVDVASGITKIYFNYPGPPAPAVTDTFAFPSSCPTGLVAGPKIRVPRE